MAHSGYGPEAVIGRRACIQTSPTIDQTFLFAGRARMAKAGPTCSEYI
jgi:hypothetical protein